MGSKFLSRLATHGFPAPKNFPLSNGVYFDLDNSDL